uniref:Zinc finger protein ZPR1 n=1 Tax=Ceriodaphnia reticulata TaxID=302197 RepID=A0A4Y7LTM8_9CRUS|nr:EOG090X06TU [Ceriodaphnia reticulata]SVE72958.1 EOG090X06TU [Ceriodaphnia reticulata]
MTNQVTNTPVFRDLQADDPDPETTEISSLCFNCGQDGVTKLLLTKIPFYKEIILMSFECDHCGFKNNEVQSGDKIQEKGALIHCSISSLKDLNRQVIKSDYATVKIPEIDFEIPPQSKRGEITTVEGILNRCIAGLEQDQPVRKALDPDSAEKIDAFIQVLIETKTLKKPFTIVIDDPSGNSYVENVNAPLVDPALTTTYYERNKEQDHLVGIYEEELNEIKEELKEIKEEDEGEEDDKNIALADEVLHFGTNCPSCNAPCETNMKVTNIPYFKEVIIMATNCESCGLRTNEVKSGAGIADKGVRITLRITDPIDLSRDVLKSETCSMSIPELDFEVGAGTLGGKFTTLEGLLGAMKDQLTGHNPLVCGDSVTDTVKERMKVFNDKLDDIISGKVMGNRIILDDPAGNSYLQNVYAPESDPEMEIVYYERTFDHNEELGLNDMKLENYSEDN